LIRGKKLQKGINKIKNEILNSSRGEAKDPNDSTVFETLPSLCQQPEQTAQMRQKFA